MAGARCCSFHERAATSEARRDDSRSIECHLCEGNRMAVHAWIADFMISMLHSLTGSLGAGHRHVVPYPARTYLLAIGMALGGVLVGCAGPTASPAATTQSQLSAGSGTPGKLTGAIGNADLAVGQDQRFQLVLIGPDNALVSDASVGVAFFKVNGPSSADLKFQAPTEYEETP